MVYEGPFELDSTSEDGPSRISPVLVVHLTAHQALPPCAQVPSEKNEMALHHLQAPTSLTKDSVPTPMRIQ